MLSTRRQPHTNKLIEPNHLKWAPRFALARRATENSIKKYIEKRQQVHQTHVYYDWHPEYGFVAYVDKNAKPSDIPGIEDYQTIWNTRLIVAERYNEKNIKRYVENRRPVSDVPIYYDWHPKHGFVAYYIQRTQT